MNIPTLKISILGTVGAVGAAIAELLGGWTGALQTLLIFMGIDILTGIMVAFIFHSSPKTENGGVESNAMFKGLCRKIVILFIVIMAVRLGQLIEKEYIKNIIIIAFIGNEGVSIIENAELMKIKNLGLITWLVTHVKDIANSAMEKLIGADKDD